MLRPSQHAVAVDVGVDDRRDAGVLEAPREVERARRRSVFAQPSTATLPSRASMPTAMRPGTAARGLADEAGVAHRRRADDDARRRPCRASPRCVAHVADAAAELHRHLTAFEDRARRRRALTGLPANAPLRSTRCSHSKPARSNARACAAGIVVEHGRVRHVAVHQAHAFAVLEVDRGKQDHGRPLQEIGDQRKARGAWLFSGWNWVPTILSRPTMAVIGPP